MKLFTKLALVSAIAISGNVMAMESLDDAALSAATGQDGISLTIKTDEITIDKLLIHDNDGLAGGGFGVAAADATAGAIVVNDVSVKVATNAASQNAALNGALAKVNIDTNGGTGAGVNGNAVLNINAQTNGIDVTVGGIAVAKSNATASMVGARRGAGAETEIISGLNLTIGASDLNIQLGAQPQGAMIVASGTINDGIKINSLNLKDTVGGGTIAIGGLHVTTANNANLVLNTKIGVTTDGLSISSTGSNDIYIGSLAFGNNKSIGSVEIQGLSMGTNSILVSGH